MLGIELLDGRYRLYAGTARIPVVKRLQRHNAVHRHKNAADRGDNNALVPRNAVDQLQQPRQHCLDPHHAQQAKHRCIQRARASTEQPAKPLIVVIPCHSAKADFHKPAYEILERATDNRANDKNKQHVFIFEAVERDCHEHRTHAVNGAKRSVKQARAILVHTGINGNHVKRQLNHIA